MSRIKKAEAYIDTVVTVFIGMMIVYVTISLFSYFLAYQRLDNAADNIIRCAAVSGSTSDSVIGEKTTEYLTAAGLKKENVSISFTGTDYLKDKTVQYGDTIILNISTQKTYKYIGKTGSSAFNLSINKVAISEKYSQETQ